MSWPDLWPSAQQQGSSLTIPLGWFSWLPALGVTLFGAGHAAAQIMDEGPHAITIDRSAGETLAAIDQIRRGQQRSLRAGWLFVAGRQPLRDGRMLRVFTPLLSVPVRIKVPLLGDAEVWPAGDISVTELVTDPARRHELEASYDLGGGALDHVEQAYIPDDLLRRLDRLRSFALRRRRRGRLRRHGHAFLREP